MTNVSLINCNISNNVCNKNQLISVGSSVVHNAGGTITINNALVMRNVNISKNICGAIGFLCKDDYPTYGYASNTTNGIFNTNTSNSLTINNNNCKLIYLTDGNGNIGNISHGAWTRTTSLLSSVSTGSTNIINNTCSWIQVGTTCPTGFPVTLTNSSLTIRNNKLTAYDSSFLVGYYDILGDVLNIAILIDTSSGAA